MFIPEQPRLSTLTGFLSVGVWTMNGKIIYRCINLYTQLLDFQISHPLSLLGKIWILWSVLKENFDSISTDVCSTRQLEEGMDLLIVTVSFVWHTFLSKISYLYENEWSICRWTDCSKACESIDWRRRQLTSRLNQIR